MKKHFYVVRYIDKKTGNECQLTVHENNPTDFYQVTLEAMRKDESIVITDYGVKVGR